MFKLIFWKSLIFSELQWKTQNSSRSISSLSVSSMFSMVISWKKLFKKNTYIISWKIYFRFNNSYAVKSHELLCHSEHFQCNSCKHISPLDQPEEFKLHLFKHESRKHECIRCGFTSPTLKSLEAHFKSEGCDGSVHQIWVF